MAVFYYHPRMLTYDFGPQHPFKSERLRRSAELLEEMGVVSADPGGFDPADLLRVHSKEYVQAIRNSGSLTPETGFAFGVGTGDTPLFPNMFEASCHYCSGTIRAAQDVASGTLMATTLAGGLHHAHRSHASGFCVFNDCAIALSILRDRFERVAYVDIDVHHGDGVQAIYYKDPTVLTCSIHQDGRTLYPGTGFESETGADHSCVNVPLWPGTDGEEWLSAFRSKVLPAIERFKPEAIVLQMGADSHALDPLANINNTVHHWLEAVSDVRTLGLPMVASGGGGYNMSTTVRMWVSAILTLLGVAAPAGPGD